MLTGFLFVPAANATEEDYQRYKGLSEDALTKACVFGDKLYSDGAVFCSAKHSPLTCQSGSWVFGGKLDAEFCDATHLLRQVRTLFLSRSSKPRPRQLAQGSHDDRRFSPLWTVERIPGGQRTLALKVRMGRECEADSSWNDSSSKTVGVLSR